MYGLWYRLLDGRWWRVITSAELINLVLHVVERASLDRTEWAIAKSIESRIINDNEFIDQVRFVPESRLAVANIIVKSESILIPSSLGNPIRIGERSTAELKYQAQRALEMTADNLKNSLFPA